MLKQQNTENTPLQLHRNYGQLRLKYGQLRRNYGQLRRPETSLKNLHTRIAGAGSKRRETSEGAFYQAKSPFS